MINHPFGCFEKKKVFCNPYNHYYPLLSLAAQCGIGMTGEATKLKLEIYDGPHCSAPDGKVAFSAEAIIIGFPDPGIDFGDDSNVSPLGPCRVEVSVKAGESYTLTATNSQGTASASIVLEEECREESAGKDEDSGEDAEEIEVELEAESEPAEEDNSDDSMTQKELKKIAGKQKKNPNTPKKSLKLLQGIIL